MNNQNKPERFPCDDEHVQRVSLIHTNAEYQKKYGDSLLKMHTLIEVSKNAYNQAIEDCLAIARTADLEFKSRFLEEIENLKKK